MASTRNKLIQLIVLSVLVVAALIYFTADKTELIIRATEGTSTNVRELSITLKGDIKISNARGHAHSPFGISGRDRYSFDGVVVIDGDRISVTTDSYEIFAAFEYQGDYFLVAREYFHQINYRVLGVNQDQEAAVLPPTEIPFELRTVKFAEPKVDYLFKAWNLNVLHAAKQVDALCDLLTAYSDEDSRFAFPNFSWQEIGARRTEMLDIFDSELLRNTCKQLDKILKGALEASKHDDDPQILARIAFGLLKINPEENGVYLCEFKEKVRAEEIADDKRMSALGVSFYVARELDCPF